MAACTGVAAPAVPVPPLTPGTTAAPAAESPAASICGALPLDAAAWVERFATAKEDGDERGGPAALFRQGQALSAELRQWTREDLAVVDDAAAPDRMRRALAVAYLNIADGRLHRASLLADEGGAATVGDLLSQAEADLARGSEGASWLPALERVSRGEGLNRRACAQAAALGPSNTLLQLTRWEDGISSTTLLEAPASASFPWMITGAYPSLDYRWVALTTCTLETGGPVLLFDAIAGAWVDLIAEYRLALSESGTVHPQDESATWQVIGWHPTSSHLLLAVEGQNLAFWVDLEGSYRRITLAETGESVGGERHLALMPDGSGLAYVTNDGHRLERYDFATGGRTVIWEQSNGEGRINYPRFCPSGDSVAFLTEPGQVGGRRMCRLEVVTLAGGLHQVLAEGSVCLDAPRWSAEGDAVALRQDGGRADSSWTVEGQSGEYSSAAAHEATQCRLPRFARAEAARVAAQGRDASAEWAAVVRAAASGTDTAYFIP